MRCKLRTSLFALRALILILLTPFLIAADTPHPAPTTNPLFIDFVQYWSAARLLRDGQNPYDPDLIAVVERTAIPDLSEPILQWNPPSVFFLTWPLGFLSFSTAQALWMASLLCLIACALLHTYKNLILSSLNSWPRKLILAVAILFFSPLWESLRFGQISPFLLIGFVGFLLFRSNPVSTRYSFIAGLCLSLTLLKPHLLFLVYLLLLCESVKTKQIACLLGLLFGGFCASIVPLAFRPSLWADYWHALAEWPVYFQTPTLGSWMQYLLPDDPIARFAPSIIGACATAYVFLYRLPAERFSTQHLSTIACFSLFLAPYGWVFDQLLLLPALLMLSAASIQGCIIALVINLLAFPWSGIHPMQYKVWYPITLGVAALYVRRRAD